MARQQKFNVFRDGRVHITRPLCATCIYRPGNEETGARVIRLASADQTAVVCHSTLDHPNQSICGGFAAKDPTYPIKVALELGCVSYDPAPSKRA